MRTVHALIIASAFMAVGSQAQDTAFTYQGLLSQNGEKASGVYQVRFTLHGAESGGSVVAGPITNSAVPVVAGLFTTTLDFGGAVFDGARRWLELGVATNGGDTFTTLTPRQEIRATPYAIAAARLTSPLSSNGLAGTYSEPISFINPANIFAGNGGGLTNVQAMTLGGLVRADLWQLGGNSGAGSNNFLGTTDNQPLELRVNNTTALRVEPTFGGVNMIGGYRNRIGLPMVGGTIGGGSSNRIGIPVMPAAYSTISGGVGNEITGHYGTIGGGSDNDISLESLGGTISGGRGNAMTAENTGQGDCTIGGGYGNHIQGPAVYSTISGGSKNAVVSLHAGQGASMGATIAGGWLNAIISQPIWPDTGSVIGSTISGGHSNRIISRHHDTIGGGFANSILESTGAVISGGASNLIEANSLYSSIGGGQANTVKAPYATIGGGSAHLISGSGSPFQRNTHVTIAGGFSNSIGFAEFATVAGGMGNRIGCVDNGCPAPFSAISGGSSNSIIGATYATIGGGAANQIHTSIGPAFRELYSTISGGAGNAIYSSRAGAIGGGEGNRISAACSAATIGGGLENVNNAEMGTIGGGSRNVIGGSCDGGFPPNRYSTIGGGAENVIEPGVGWFTISGGYGNTIQSGFRNQGATISGGRSNSVGKASSYSSIGGGLGNTTEGNNSVIGGGGENVAQADCSTIPGGVQANASNYGQMAYASGQFAAVGDAQTSVYVCRGSTTDATPTELLLDGVSERITMPTNSTWTFDIQVTARASDGTSAAYQILGAARNNGGITTLASAPKQNILVEDDPSWNAVPFAAAADNKLAIRVTGAAATSVRWVATIRTTEVTY